jgi:predicted nucleotidyltransferase
LTNRRVNSFSFQSVRRGPSIDMVLATRLRSNGMRQAKSELANDPVLLSMLERIRSTLDPERVYLFGSRARGQATPDSDYDFLVVVPHSEKPRYRRDQEAYLALCGSGAAKDIIVLTRAEFESSRRVASSLTSAVLSEGILLHESGNAS